MVRSIGVAAALALEANGDGALKITRPAGPGIRSRLLALPPAEGSLPTDAAAYGRLRAEAEAAEAAADAEVVFA
jgi:hypothetical protein